MLLVPCSKRAVQTTCCVSSWSLVACIWAMLEILGKRSGPRSHWNNWQILLVACQVGFLMTRWRFQMFWIFTPTWGRFTFLTGIVLNGLKPPTRWHNVQIVAFAEVPELFLFVFLCLGCIAILVGQLAMSRDSQWDWACATFRQTYFFLVLAVFRQLFGGLSTWNLQLGRGLTQPCKIEGLETLSNSIKTAVGMGKSSENLQVV